MLSGFLARKRIPKLKPGSPIMTALEVSAQSDVRSTQDQFAALSSTSLERASRTSLLRIGADEDVPLLSERPATVTLTFGDSSFTKKTTRLSTARSAPIVGSTTIYLASVAGIDGWATTGSIYLGRGTSNSEGPIAYSALVDSGSFWTMTLDSATERFHPQGEEIILAQGGDRVIPAGQAVSTERVATTTPVEFTTLFQAVILDGEVSIAGVYGVCSTPGTVGNIAQGGISRVISPPFSTCTVVNPTVVSNGVDTEADPDYRDRIRTARATRAKATARALVAGVIGKGAADDRRVVSAAVVRRENRPTALVIDDGNGYEETSDAISIEPLVSFALGGEDSFQLSSTPVAKAFVASSNTAPFDLSGLTALTIRVGGVPHELYVPPSAFRDPASAAAFEVVDAINSNVASTFSAATAEGGTKVRIFARADTNEDIEVVEDVDGDISTALQLGATQSFTARLYKNDRLLLKDGAPAVVISLPYSLWPTISGSQTLDLAVDGTPATTYTIVDADFVTAGTGFSSVANNSLAAWAAVLNYRIPGITVTVQGDTLRMESNLGRNSRAALSIEAGTLMSASVLPEGGVAGGSSDYALNRSTGEIALTTPLSPGDTLSVGTFNTRAFTEAADIGSLTLASDAIFWVVSDGDVQEVATAVNVTDSYSLAKVSSGAWGEQWSLSTAVGAPFTDVDAFDWLVLWDTAVDATLLGAWRIGEVASTQDIRFTTRATGTADNAAFTFNTAGLRVFRSTRQPQKVTIPAGSNYTADSLAATITEQLNGAEGIAYRTDNLRIKTLTFGGGEISVVAIEDDALSIGLTEETVVNSDSHLASVESQSQVGTPSFSLTNIYNAAGLDAGDVIVEEAATYLARVHDRILAGFRGFDPAFPGNNTLFSSAIASVSNNADGDDSIVTRKDALQQWQEEDFAMLRAPYSVGPEDEVTFLVNGETRFVCPLYRRLKAVGSTYGATNTFIDADNSDESLTQAFALDYDFNDFAVAMKARALTHAADATKRVLWRSKRWGDDGAKTVVRYAYPTEADAATSVEVDNTPTATGAFPTAPAYNFVSVRLPSGARKTGFSVRSSTRIGYSVWSTAVPQEAFTICIGFPIASATRAANVTTLTLTMPTGTYAIVDHGLQIGDQIYVADTSGSFSSGLKTLTGVGVGTVSYAEVAANVGPIASIGTLSFDSAEALFTGATPTAIAAGDIMRLEDLVGLPATLRSGRSLRINTFGPQFIQGYLDENISGAESDTLAWAPLADSGNLKFFSLAGDAASDIAAAVNAIDLSPVTATDTGDGTGVIDLSSREEGATSAPFDEWTLLLDGINWVETTTPPGSMAGNYQLLFKAPISAGLVADSDWDEEEVRIYPITAQGVAAWLATPAVSGLFSVAAIDVSRAGDSVQVAVVNAGSEGSIQVQGGTGNAANAAVIGSASSDDDGNYTSLDLPAASVRGIVAGNWVKVENVTGLPKAGLITSATALTSIDGEGAFQLAAGPDLYTLADSGAFLGNFLIVGKYVAIVGVGNGLATAGDWIQISGAGVTAANRGLFKIVHAEENSLLPLNAIWIENSNAVEEYGVTGDFKIVENGSMIPGDIVSISTDAWGADNRGNWVVTDVGSDFTDPTTFSVAVSVAPTTAQGAVAALGAEASLVVVTQGTPTVTTQLVTAVAPHETDASIVTIKLRGAADASRFGEAAGTVVTALDKLAFPTARANGIDGYRYNTGLIGEINKVVYGDPASPAVYPGIAGAGTRIVVRGPAVRRIQVALALRIRLGASPAEVLSRVRSAVASFINDSKVGQSVPLSGIVAAAASVNGIQAVSVVSPVYSSSSDLIAVQSGEKALVLDPLIDISLSIVGE